VVAPDLPGSIFGETATSRASQARLGASVVFLDRLTATLDLDQVALHGLSMGGMAGLLFAAEHGRVERLVLVSSLLPAPMRGLEWFAQPRACGRPDAAGRQAPCPHGVRGPAFASATSSAFVSRRRMLTAIDRVAVPVLLVWGDQDRLVVRSVIDHALQRRPDWELHVLESVGHNAPLEQPGAYVDAFLRWSEQPPHP
jgi:pimeloyl-ACP methyl ester carboxylesterase